MSVIFFLFDFSEVCTMRHVPYNIPGTAYNMLSNGCCRAAAVAVGYHSSNLQAYYQTPHLGENAKQESKCYVRNPWVQGNTVIHEAPGDGGLLSPRGSRNYACVMTIPDLP